MELDSLEHTPYKVPRIHAVREQILADQGIQAAIAAKRKPSKPQRDLHAMNEPTQALDLDLSASVEALLCDFGLLQANPVDLEQDFLRFSSDAEDDSLLTMPQLAVLLSFVPSNRWPADYQMPGPSSRKQDVNALLDLLSLLALQPAMTGFVYARFRPIWVDLVARWLSFVNFNGVDFGTGPQDDRKVLDVFSAFTRILDWDQTVFPLFLTFLRHPTLAEDPFELILNDLALERPGLDLPGEPLYGSPTLSQPDNKTDGIFSNPFLTQLLLALYRLLTHLPYLPAHATLKAWSIPSPFLIACLQRHPLISIRLLAWRISCLWLGTLASKGEELRLEWVYTDRNDQHAVKQVAPFPVEEAANEEVLSYEPVLLGKAELRSARCLIGVRHRKVDSWLLPDVESQQEQYLFTQLNDRPLLFTSTPASSGTMDIDEPIPKLCDSHFCPWTINISGLLLMQESYLPSISYSPSISASVYQSASFVLTKTAQTALRTLASHVSHRRPIIFIAPSSSGKSATLEYLSAQMHCKSSLASQNLVTINLADRSIDAKSLLGSLSSSPTEPGQFIYLEGTLTRCLRQGKWLVLKDIDKAAEDVLVLISSLAERMRERSKNLVGGAFGGVTGRGSVSVEAGHQLVEAAEGFMLFATQSKQSGQAPSDFIGSQFWQHLVTSGPGLDEVKAIVEDRFPNILPSVRSRMLEVWSDMQEERSRSNVGSGAGRERSLRDLLKWCQRCEVLMPTPMIDNLDSNPTFMEELFIEACDVFLGASEPASQLDPTSSEARTIDILSDRLALSKERCNWILQNRSPTIIEPSLGHDSIRLTNTVLIGRSRMQCSTQKRVAPRSQRPYAITKPSAILLEQLAAGVQQAEPLLLVGETGTGKTTTVARLAEMLGKPLVALNLSNQSEASDILGGFKPVDTASEAIRRAAVLVDRFIDLFEQSFGLARNESFVTAIRLALSKKRWKRLVALIKEAVKMFEVKFMTEPQQPTKAESRQPKRQKLDVTVLASDWQDTATQAQAFDIEFAQGRKATNKIAFSFVEGPLVKALKDGDWILLDELNLASAETLESLSTLLQSAHSSIVLTERGDLHPVSRHPDFRLFACMNPATDAGKRDLPPALRSKFTELHVRPIDSDREALLSVVLQYIGPCCIGDRGAVADVADCFLKLKSLASSSQLADGANHPPHYSMRTLTRALQFAATNASAFTLRRALYEGFLMTFTMSLDSGSHARVIPLLQRQLLGAPNKAKSILARKAMPPPPLPSSNQVFVGPFWLPQGPLQQDDSSSYVLTDSVTLKLQNLARAVFASLYPVLIQGPTSSGKTSVIEYLARKTGNRFVRINNHEHTDIQEYIGSYVADADTGSLVFREGLLVQALRRGDWLVLDELNLAPSDVLEALNRLLDDNRELLIPETQEIVRPHSSFRLFATQNPPGSYGGRKVLSRAFRNRFLEMHYDNVPQNELQIILSQRCQIAPSYAARIVDVFVELQRRRQIERVFEEKEAFITLRDLFRWGARGAVGYEQLASDGFMLLAERTRNSDDRKMVKTVIESQLKSKIDTALLYQTPSTSSSDFVWTQPTQRLYALVQNALQHKEPVLLIGEAGSGKTSVCQKLALDLDIPFYSLNCHMNTEATDILGGLRPVRSRASTQVSLKRDISAIFAELSVQVPSDNEPFSVWTASLTKILQLELVPEQEASIKKLLDSCQRAMALFEWQDGPLVQAMKTGGIFLLDEISLADDSVLERLNSVLEPARTLVLAEKGGLDAEEAQLVAHPNFLLVATMNPGGDFGKKELSPALRNRFTEIWVDKIKEDADVTAILHHKLSTDVPAEMAQEMLRFSQWFNSTISRTDLSLRDLLAWCAFINTATSKTTATLVHGAFLTYIDSIGSLPSYATASERELRALQQSCVQKLDELTDGHFDMDTALSPQLQVDASSFTVGEFKIESHAASRPSAFDFASPTPRANALRLARAMQIAKPVLLEGSPGVGKTSIVDALASITGNALCRINLSDQSDLMDLFGSDMPVEGGESGQFEWKNAPFLTAMQNGDWVLLDEMNLASQPVLEGLNSCLDHRGEVFVPELNRSFRRHPAFRIFAAQNPLAQGGNRKGLPRSFLDRFTRVFLHPLTAKDLVSICQAAASNLPQKTVELMVDFVGRLARHASDSSSFAQHGAPWEFNLRDVLRWIHLANRQRDLHIQHNLPDIYADLAIFQRFRTPEDRRMARTIYEEVCSTVPPEDYTVEVNVRSKYLQIGSVVQPRSDLFNLHFQTYAPSTLATGLSASMQNVVRALQDSRLLLLVGESNSGKSTLLRQTASLVGTSIDELPLNSQTDSLDLLGSFEQTGRTVLWNKISDTLEAIVRSLASAGINSLEDHLRIRRLDLLLKDIHHRLNHLVNADISDAELQSILQRVENVANMSETATSGRAKDLQEACRSLLQGSSEVGRFAWIDGPLLRAMEHGYWLVLDNANLCPASVLDRLNSLVEPNGLLLLNERGLVDGNFLQLAPHPNFRLILTVNPRHGELSRAMRNRSVELFMPTLPASSIDTVVPLNQSLQPSAQPFNTTKADESTLQATNPSLYGMSSRICDNFSQIANEHLSGPLARHLVSSLQVEAKARGFPADVFASKSMDPAYSPYAVEIGDPAAPPSSTIALSVRLELLSRLLFQCSVTSPQRSKSTSAQDLRNLLASLLRALIDYYSGPTSEFKFDSQKPIFAALANHVAAVDFAIELKDLCMAEVTDLSTLSQLLPWLSESLDSLDQSFAATIRYIKNLDVDLSRLEGKAMASLWNVLISADGLYSEDVRILRRELVDVMGSRLPMRGATDLLDLTLDVVASPPPISSETHRYAQVCRELTQEWHAIPIEGKDEDVADVTVTAQRLLNNVFGEAQLHVLSTTALASQRQRYVFPVPPCLGKDGLNFTLWLNRYKATDCSNDSGTAPSYKLNALYEALAYLVNSGASICTVFEARNLEATVRLRLQIDSVSLSYATEAKIAESLAAAQYVKLASLTYGKEDRTSSTLSLITSVLRETLVAVNVLPERDSESAMSMTQLLAHSKSALSAKLPSETLAFVYHEFGHLSNQQNSTTTRLRQLSLAALRAAAIIWALYVPAIPLDPAIAAMAKLHFLEKKEARLLERIRSLSDNDPAVRQSRFVLLWEELCQVRMSKAEQQPVTVQRKSSPADLAALYREMQRSYDQFLHPNKAEAVFTSTESGRTARVVNMRTSLQSATTRLQTVYAEYSDLIKPVVLCYNAAIVGLTTLQKAQEMEVAVEKDVSVSQMTLQHLCQAPTEVVRAHLVSNRSWESSPASLRPLCLPLLRLQAFAMLSTSDAFRRLHQIESLFSDLHQYWKTWQSQKQQQEENAKSLYKSRFQISSDAAEDIDDEQLAEREVLELFGTTDIIASRPGPSSEASQDVPALSSSDFALIATAHIAIFDAETQAGKAIHSNFTALHSEAVRQLVDRPGSKSDDSLDQLSTNLQLDLITSAADDVEARPTNTSFYHAADPTESIEVAKMLEVLLAAVKRLKDEWPEQMILIDIENRVNQVLALRTNLPVARLLGAMEHVLPAIDDWEKVSSKEYSLVTHQNALIQRIIRYRQLELESWPKLLDVEDQAFSDRSNEYWMPLYESIVQAPLRIAQDPTNNIDDHMRELTTIIDTFLRDSPVGQFKRRLLLLSTFALFAQISPSVPSGVAMLVSSIHSHYCRLSPAVDRWKLDQRTKVVSDVKEIIKLASWKDVNVVALKLSAQKSHRQLHKIVRKYRAVLQRSAIEVAAPAAPSHLTKEQLLSGLIVKEVVLLPASEGNAPFDTGITYLKDLPSTISKLQYIREKTLLPSMSSSQQQSHSVLELAAEISYQAKSLKDTPLIGSEEVQQKQASALLTRKRRAWADLLRELKRLGLSHNPTETSRRSVQELLTYHRHGALGAKVDREQAASTFNHLYSHATDFVPRLAPCLASHHEDLTAREIARAVGSTQSLALMCIKSKGDLLNVVNGHRKLASGLRKLEAAATVDSLANMAQEGSITQSGPSTCLNAYLSFINETNASLSKLKTTILHQNSMLSTATSTEAVVEELDSLIDMTELRSSELRAALACNTEIEIGFFLQSEVKALQDTDIALNSIFTRLASIGQNHPAWRYQVAPVADYLVKARSGSLQAYQLSQPQSQPETTASLKQLIDRILVSFQRLAALSTADTNGEVAEEEDRAELPANSIKAEYSTMSKQLLALNLQGVLSALSEFMSALHRASLASELSVEQARDSIRHAQPFLAHYEATVRQYLDLCFDQNLSNLNLLQIVGQLILTISEHGFCQPTNGEAEGQSADAKGESAGTGMGEGIGGKNVSKEIEGEEQVEGLQNEAPAEEEDAADQPDDDERVEMETDFEGKLEDAKEEESGAEGQEDEDEGSQPDADEAVDKVDPNDPNAVDEKFWGDQDDKEQPEAEERGKEATKGQDKAELGEKQEGQQKKPDDPADDIPDAPDEAQQPDEEMNADQPAEDQQMEDYAGPSETDKLDLPEAAKEDEQVLPDDAEMDEMDDQPDAQDETRVDDESMGAESPRDATADDQAEASDGEDIKGDQEQVEGLEEDNAEDSAEKDLADQGDIEAGSGDTAGGSGQAEEQSLQAEKQSQPEASKSQRGPDQTAQDAATNPDTTQVALDDAEEAGKEGSSGQDRGLGQAEDANAANETNSSQQLGSALQQWERTLKTIQQAAAAEDPANLSEPQSVADAMNQDVQHLNPDESSTLQAVGTLADQEASQLRDAFPSNDHEGADATQEANPDVEMAEVGQDLSSLPSVQLLEDERPGTTDQFGAAESRNLPNTSTQDRETSSRLSEPEKSVPQPNGNVVPSSEDIQSDAQNDLQLLQWHRGDREQLDPAAVWQHYLHLTRNVSHGLTEQLRLVLEPTLATRLQGDYKSGKRLNMRRIIQYIASDFSKDKIWLRRTKPSQREYQVMLAVDDSKSMSDSMSIHLAFQTLALVSTALQKLEVGDIAVARFGEMVQMVKSFDSGPLTEADGGKLVSDFTFIQKSTNVRKLLEESLAEFARARSNRRSSTSADVWQLQLIISDGIVEEQDQIRALLRQAISQKVFVVFIVLDSLQNKSSTSTSQSAPVSILDMKEVQYAQDASGAMSLKMTPYLDKFPFDYYVILRDTNALPAVLSQTLKQFFEMVSSGTVG